MQNLQNCIIQMPAVEGRFGSTTTTPTDRPTDHRPRDLVLGRSVRGRIEIRTTRPTTASTAISYYSVGRFLKPSLTGIDAGEILSDADQAI